MKNLLRRREQEYTRKALNNDVSLERLQRFFVKAKRDYQISKTIRDMIIFARQDMVKDPPFSELDLISCRNVIIYMRSSLQKKLFPIFHYSLKQKGVLFLGSSESANLNLFELLDKKYKIYLKKAVITPSIKLTASDYVAAALENHIQQNQNGPVPGVEFNVQEEADHIIQSQYTPAGVIVNSDLEIIQFRGRTGAYLEPASGKASLKLFKMVREGLSLGLHGAINKADKENIPVKKEGLQIINHGQTNRVNVNVFPIMEPINKKKYFLILFEQVAPQTWSVDNAVNAEAKLKQETHEDINNQLIDLRNELTITKEHLQSTIEKYEFTNEALRAANEEIQSSNEELLSMNEELETAKEELQSTNEELMTLNDEMQNRNIELGIVSDDLHNLFRSLAIPVVMLNNNLLIRRFNSAAEKIFKLINTDVGRPLTDINTNFNNINLEKLILEVIDTLSNKEVEVQDRNGCWYSLQIRPYRTTENKIDGVVITFFDIDIIKKNLESSQEAREYAEAIVDTVRESLLVLDAGLHIESANKAFYQIFKVSPADTVNSIIYNLGNGQWDIPELRILLEDILDKDITFEGFKVEHDFQYIGLRRMLLNARRIIDQKKQTKLILLAIEDITFKKEA